MANTSWTRKTATPNPYLYNAGSEFNDETKWYETFYRGYDPYLGRFNGVDVMADSYGSMNPYQYSFNDPVFWNDPMGDDPGRLIRTDDTPWAAPRDQRGKYQYYSSFKEWAAANQRVSGGIDRSWTSGGGSFDREGIHSWNLTNATIAAAQLSNATGLEVGTTYTVGSTSGGGFTEYYGYTDYYAVQNPGWGNSPAGNFETGGVTIYADRFLSGENVTLSRFTAISLESIRRVNGYFLEPPGPSTIQSGLDRRIPAGVYEVEAYSGTDHPNTWIIYNGRVPKSRAILIHTGNLPCHTEGCQITGTDYGFGNMIDTVTDQIVTNTFYVTGSGGAYNKLDGYLRTYGSKGIRLVITDFTPGL